MRYLLILCVLIGAFILLWFGVMKGGEDVSFDGVSKSKSLPADESEKNPIVILSTTKGEIAIELFMDKTPVTAANFLTLAKEGFYTATKFHRVIKGFMVQGGDPNSKGDTVSLYGRGGPGYTIQDEFVEGLSNVRGTISMANTGQPNSGGSQFFINLVDNTGLDFNKEPLTSRHPVFGKVVSGMNVVDEIAHVATGQGDVPVKAVVIERITIKED